MKKHTKLNYILFLLKPYWDYGKAYILLSLFVSMLLKPFSAFLSTLLPQKSIDAMVVGADKKEIFFIIIAFSLGILFISIIEKLEKAYSDITVRKIDYKIKNEVNQKALYTDFKYYDDPNFFTKFVFAQEQYPQGALSALRTLPQFLQSIITVVTMGAVITSAGPVLLCITIFFVVINALVELPILKPRTHFNLKMTEIVRPFNYVDRVLKQKENAAELKTSSAGKKFLNSISSVIMRMQTAYEEYLKKVLPFNIIQGALTPIQTSCILAYIIFFVIDGDITKIGLYASLTIACTTLATNLSSVVESATDLLELTFYGEQVFDFFEAESQIEPLDKLGETPPQNAYELEFKNVSFSYNNSNQVIKNLNLNIPKGQRVAIVGENGMGKSTIMKLLIRLYDVTDGEILINGKNIKEYDVHKLREHIGIAFQDIRILAMSLRDNLTAYNDLPDEELVEIIRKLGLGNILEKANYDLNTMISKEFVEDGLVLSGGEAQRLSLARLFTRDFGLLLLDEPTSALDPFAENDIINTLNEISQNTTTIMIAHRLSTVKEFDIIYLIEDGNIVEFGSHQELIKKHGKYYEMFTCQAKNYK